jgi:hypothetical protein
LRQPRPQAHDKKFDVSLPGQANPAPATFMNVYTNYFGPGWLQIVMAIAAAMVSYNLYEDLFLAIICFFFWPFAFIKWLICREISLSVLRNTFLPFLK